MKQTNYKQKVSIKSDQGFNSDLSRQFVLVQEVEPKNVKSRDLESMINQVTPLPKPNKVGGENQHQAKASIAEVKIEYPIDTQNAERKKTVYCQRSKALNITRMFTLVLSNFYAGYFVIIGGVLSPTLTDLVYELPEDERSQVTGNFGFFLSVGCIASNMLSGVLAKHIGRVKLIIVLEACRIVCSLVYRIENLYLFYTMRFASGFLGTIGLGLVPFIINEMIPSELTGYGGSLSFTFITLGLFVGSLQSRL